MLNPPDPRSTWMDEASPSSATGQRNFPSRPRRTMADTEENSRRRREGSGVVMPSDDTADTPAVARPLPPPIRTTSLTGNAHTDASGLSADTPAAYAFAPPRPIQKADPRTPTPTTPEFREMIASYVDQPDEVDRVLEMFECVAAARVAKIRESLASMAALQTTQRAATTPKPDTIATLRKIQLEALRLRVQQRLLPAKTIILNCQSTEELPNWEQARLAARHAYQAHIMVKDTLPTQVLDDVGVTALLGLCRYYMALAEWLMVATRQERRESLPMSREEAPILECFEQARNARAGGYREGEWAAGWVAYLTEQGSTATSGQDQKNWAWVIANKMRSAKAKETKERPMSPVKSTTACPTGCSCACHGPPAEPEPVMSEYEKLRSGEWQRHVLLTRQWDSSPPEDVDPEQEKRDALALEAANEWHQEFRRIMDSGRESREKRYAKYAATQAASKESTLKESASKESTSQESSPKDSTSQESTWDDSVSLKSTSTDATSIGSSPREPVLRSFVEPAPEVLRSEGVNLLESTVSHMSGSIPVAIPLFNSPPSPVLVTGRMRTRYTDDDEEPTLPPPVTSPRLQKRTPSITLSLPASVKGKEPVRSSSPRTPSFLSRITGRQKQKSEIEEAEEGDSTSLLSPEERGRAGSMRGENGWVQRQRKGASLEEEDREDMV